MSNFSLRVTSMTGFGRFAAPEVVSRSHAFTVVFQLQLARSTRELVFPAGNVPVTEVRFGDTSRNALVDPEKFGARSNTVPLAEPLAKPSKSVKRASASGDATAVFVNLTNAPSLTTKLVMGVSTGGTVTGSPTRSSQFS